MENKTFEQFDWSACRFPAGYTKSIFDYATAGGFKRGLEIGFDSGSSALAFLRALPEATLKSVDIYPCELGNELINNSEVKGSHIFIQADSREWLKSYTPLALYDYIFIDGDHDYAVALQDIENAYPLLAQGGKMLIDDADPNHQHFGVYKAVQEFLVKHPECSARHVDGNPNMAMELWRI